MGKENFKPGVIHLGKEKLFGKGDVKMPGEKSSPTRGGYKGGMSKSKSSKFTGKKVGKGDFTASKPGGIQVPSAPAGGGGRPLPGGNIKPVLPTKPGLPGSFNKVPSNAIGSVKKK